MACAVPTSGATFKYDSLTIMALIAEEEIVRV